MARIDRMPYRSGSSPSRTRWARPVFELQFTNALELRRVVRHEREAERTSMCRDKQIVGADHRATLLEIGPDLRVVNGRVVIKTHGVNVGKKRQERRSIVV